MFALKLYTLTLSCVAVAVTSALDLEHATGATGTEVDGRITGGDLAHENQFPYQVGLSIEFCAGQFTWCGGSLISEQWILTAAHCVEEIKLITIYMGSVKRLQPMIIVQLTAENVHLHHEWNNRTLVNDIALLYLPTAVPFNAGIHPVALPRMIAKSDMPVSYAYREAIVTGWGRMSDSSPAISNDLRYVVRYVQSNEECQHVYGASVKSTNICIDTTGGKSPCTGDSGGPLVVQNNDDDISDVVLIGLTSFGKTSGCTNGMPAVFTRITSYLDWIQEIAGIAYY